MLHRWILLACLCFSLIAGSGLDRAGQPGRVQAGNDADIHSVALGVTLSVDCVLTDVTVESIAVALCQVSVTNSGSERIAGSLMNFSLRDAKGKRYDRSTSALEATGRYEDRLNATKPLATGSSISGYLGFRVPDSAPRPVTFEFVKDFSSSDRSAANFLSIAITLELWPVSAARATIRALQTEESFLKTAVAPTATSTATPTVTASPTRTSTSTTVPEEATIAALETAIAAIKSGTLPPTDTPALSPTPSRTTAPSSTPTATVTAAPVPTELAAFAADDALYRCDEIGWNTWTEAGESAPDYYARYDHYYACAANVKLVVACGYYGAGAYGATQYSDNGDVYCGATVLNVGLSAFHVSPRMFTLVDASGQRHRVDPSLMNGVTTTPVFPTDDIPTDEWATGGMGFVVPQDELEGNHVEFTFDTGAAEKVILIIILIPLPQFDVDSEVV